MSFSIKAYLYEMSHMEIIPYWSNKYACSTLKNVSHHQMLALKDMSSRCNSDVMEFPHTTLRQDSQSQITAEITLV